MYKIEREEFLYTVNNSGDKDVILVNKDLLSGEYNKSEQANYNKSEQANDKIICFAEAWRKEAILIQHHAGQSVIYFNWGYVQFSRSQDIQNI